MSREVLKAPSFYSFCLSLRPLERQTDIHMYLAKHVCGEAVAIHPVLRMPLMAPCTRMCTCAAANIHISTYAYSRMSNQSLYMQRLGRPRDGRVAVEGSRERWEERYVYRSASGGLT